MGYKGESFMDSGYYVGGDPRGMLYIPPKQPDGRQETPYIIPWEHLLDESNEEVETIEAETSHQRRGLDLSSKY